MTRPTLTDLSPRAQAEARAQLQRSPHPRTVKIEPAPEPEPIRPKRGKEIDATAFFVAAGLPAPVREFRFHPTRKWRFDYAWPSRFIALEVEGGIFIQGRHSRGAGMLKDMEKYNAAALMGWRVFKTTPSKLRSKETLAMLAIALA